MEPLVQEPDFFFNDTATTEIYPLSLHDALPISQASCDPAAHSRPRRSRYELNETPHPDRKSTRLNSSHGYISYAVFCLNKHEPGGNRGEGRRPPSPVTLCPTAAAPRRQSPPGRAPLPAAGWYRPLPRLFFFNDAATTEIYTLSLHDALPI